MKFFGKEKTLGTSVFYFLWLPLYSRVRNRSELKISVFGLPIKVRRKKSNGRIAIYILGLKIKDKFQSGACNSLGYDDNSIESLMLRFEGMRLLKERAKIEYDMEKPFEDYGCTPVQ
jgi:hypothetical protein